MKNNIDNINNINNALLEKISEVNRIINSFDPGEPPQSFTVRYDRNSVKQTKQISYWILGSGFLLIARSLRRSASLKTASVIIGAAAIIMAIVCLVYASTMDKTVLAEVRDDTITIKGRTYDRSDIYEINGAALNNLKVMSDGRKVLALNKSCEGCGDLVRWAKRNNIPINDSNTGDMKSIQQRNSVIAAVTIVVCLIVAFLMVFLKRA